MKLCIPERKTETPGSCILSPRSWAAFHTEGSEGLRGRSYLGKPSRAKLCEKLEENNPRPGNSMCKGPGAGKDQFEIQTGTTRFRQE